MADQLSRHTAGALTELLDGKVQPAHQRFLLDVRPADDIDPAIDGYSSNAWACAEDARCGSAGGSTKASAVRVGDSTSMHHARQPNGPGFGPADEHSAVDRQVGAPEMHPRLAQAMIPHVSR